MSPPAACPLTGRASYPSCETPRAARGQDRPPPSAFRTREQAIARYGAGIGESQFTVRGDRWRYTRYGDGSEELYDHEHDPQEWENRTGDDRDAGVQPRMKGLFDQLTPWPVPEDDGAGRSSAPS